MLVGHRGNKVKMRFSYTRGWLRMPSKKFIPLEHIPAEDFEEFMKLEIKVHAEVKRRYDEIVELARKAAEKTDETRDEAPLGGDPDREEGQGGT